MDIIIQILSVMIITPLCSLIMNKSRYNGLVYRVAFSIPFVLTILIFGKILGRAIFS